MGVTEKTAILVISFGTSYEETRKKTIEQIESDLHHAFPEYPLYRAWTSPRIRAKLQQRDGIHIMDIDEAMTQLKADGIRHKKDFDSVIICDSLMVTKQDKEEVCQAMAQEYHPDSDEILLFMGHGTEHVANELYPEMDELFKHFGYSNMHMGTVEGDFSIESFLDKLKNLHPAHVHLAPFMIVAGDHATNDMSGEDDDSWKSILEKEGYSVKCTLKGLGEIQAVRDIFIRHTKAGLDRLSEIQA